MEKTNKKYEYKKRWRVIEKKRKHHNSFVTEYVKVKFGNLYNEANCFFKALTAIHPEKLDVKKTKEFKEWKKSIMNAENPEACIIVQTLSTDVSCGENNQETEQNYTDNNQENHHYDSDERETDNDEENHYNDSSETETDRTSDESETDNNEENYRDNMLLEIPLERFFGTFPKFKVFNPQTFNKFHFDALTFRVGVVGYTVKGIIKAYIFFFHQAVE